MSAPSVATGTAAGADTQLPRLLAGMPARGALSLSEHRDLHGELPRASGSRRRADTELIELVEQAGLRGRGGASFPMATKLRAVAAAVRSPLSPRPIVLINAAEGEPASAKDHMLLSALPHLVLDGSQLAARAVGAEEIVLCISEAAPTAQASAAKALAEREGRQRGKANPHIRLLEIPDHYVAGQESALVNYVNGGPALPTFTPPLPSQRGVRGRPTLVSNVETLAQLTLIAHHGPAWFRALGTPTQPGSALVTLCGPVPYPGVYEIAYGTSLTSLLDGAGGVAQAPRAILLGGYTGTWIMGEAIADITLCDAQLAPYGASLGAGVIALLSKDACPVAELVRMTRWLAAQSAGQCGPCVFGLDAIATGVEELAYGNAGSDIQRRLNGLGPRVRERGACRHPDGVARLLASSLQVFAEEFADHAHYGPCGAGCQRSSELPWTDTTDAIPPRRKTPKSMASAGR